MQKIPAPEKNLIFSALSSDVKNRLLPQFELVLLERGTILYESNHVLNHIYFPIDAIVALVYVVESGASSEISLVGNEGIVSIFTLLSNEGTCSQAWVMSAGYAYRLPKQAMQEELNRDAGNTLQLLLRYIQALITQLSLTAVCNRHHSIEQQLCRLLLLSLDRLPCNNLNMTQEMISNMLGVRREGITEAAGKLQKLGIINYCRGHIIILDRPQLEHLACECYAVVKKETDRLLPYIPYAASINTHSGQRSNPQENPSINSNCPACFKLEKCTFINRKIKQLKTSSPQIYSPTKTSPYRKMAGKSNEKKTRTCHHTLFINP